MLEDLALERQERGSGEVGIRFVFEEGGEAVQVLSGDAVGRGLGGVHAGFEAQEEVGLIRGGGEEGRGVGVVEEGVLGFWVREGRGSVVVVVICGQMVMRERGRGES